MIEHLIYFSPLMVLLCGLPVFLLERRQKTTSYRCFYLARIFLVVSFILSVIFFNKPLITNMTIGNHFTLLSTILMYSGAFMLMFFSRKWFMSMKVSANVFCFGVFIALVFGKLLISSINLTLTIVCLAALLLNNILLIKKPQGKKQPIEKVYLCAALIGSVLLAVAFSLQYLIHPELSYDSLRAVLETGRENVIIFISVAFVLIVFIFLLGLAPVHFWLTEMLASATLPSFVYFILIPSVACFAGLIHLNIYALVPILNKLQFFYAGIALISVGIGAIGACSGQNIRKIFAYGAIYHQAVFFLILQRFSLGATVASWTYYIIYLLAMYGVCASLFGLKIKGEYLFMLSELNGVSYRRPYISAMLAIFIFSLLGFPPLVGFLGSFTLFNDLVMHHHLYQLIYLFIMLLVLSYAYLLFIRALYFENSKEIFDRTDVSVDVAVFLNASLMMLLMLKPQYLSEILMSMLGDLFL